MGFESGLVLLFEQLDLDGSLRSGEMVVGLEVRFFFLSLVLLLVCSGGE